MRTPLAPPSRDVEDGDDVGLVVRRFYQAVIPDPLLGPVFERFGVDWSTHIPLLCSFWNRQLFGTGDWSGNVARAHADVRAVVPFGDAELDRWLELFAETVDECFVGPRARQAKERAGQIATVLRSRSGPLGWAG
jgi:hemoglobin